LRRSTGLSSTSVRRCFTELVAEFFRLKAEATKFRRGLPS
jgi:hypothetical protein